MLLLKHIPLLMVVIFLLLTVGVALLSTKHSTTFKAYVVGNKQFSTGYLVATLLATLYGGGILTGHVMHIYSQGLPWIVISLLNTSLSCWILSWLALRMAPFMHHFSIAETIGSAYGLYPRIITALINVYASIIMITMQINVITMAIRTYIGSVHCGIITMLVILILIWYTTIGGVLVITVTDIMQLATFCMVLPLLYSWIWIKTGKSLPEVAIFLEQYKQFQFNTLCHFDTKLMDTMLIFLCSIAAQMHPVVIQRIYMSTNPMQASKVFRIVAIVSLLIKLCIILIGIFIFVLEPELKIDEVWPHIIKNIPIIFKGFLAISLLAAAMSTADSHLNTASALLSHDVVDSIMRSRKIPYNWQLQWTKVITLFIGILALILHFYSTDMLQLWQFYFSSFIPVSIAPCILAILGFRTTSYIALVGMATGIISILAWNQWISPTGGAFVSMLMNGLTMLLVHYLCRSIKKEEYKQADQ